MEHEWKPTATEYPIHGGLTKAVRRQSDDAQEFYSAQTAIDTHDRPDLTRQEDKAAADINNILKRFGVTGLLPPQRQPIYGDVDYTLDLQSSIHAVEDAKRLHRKLPKPLRDKYADWATLLEGINSGEFQRDMRALEEPPKPKDTPSPKPEEPVST